MGLLGGNISSDRGFERRSKLFVLCSIDGASSEISARKEEKKVEMNRYPDPAWV